MEDAKEVLAWVLDSGSFDELRKLLLEQLRNDAGLKQHSLQLLEGSKTLENVEWQNTRNKKTFDDLKKEIEDKLMSKASTIVWDIMTAQDSHASKLIEQKVHQGLCEVYERRHASFSRAAPFAGSSSAQPGLPHSSYHHHGSTPPSASHRMPHHQHALSQGEHLHSQQQPQLQHQQHYQQQPHSAYTPEHAFYYRQHS